MTLIYSEKTKGEGGTKPPGVDLTPRSRLHVLTDRWDRIVLDFPLTCTTKDHTESTL